MNVIINRLSNIHMISIDEASALAVKIRDLIFEQAEEKNIKNIEKILNESGLSLRDLGYFVYLDNSTHNKYSAAVEKYCDSFSDCGGCCFDIYPQCPYRRGFDRQTAQADYEFMIKYDSKNAVLIDLT